MSSSVWLLCAACACAGDPAAAVLDDQSALLQHESHGRDSATSAMSAQLDAAATFILEAVDHTNDEELVGLKPEAGLTGQKARTLLRSLAQQVLTRTDRHRDEIVMYSDLAGKEEGGQGNPHPTEFSQCIHNKGPFDGMRCLRSATEVAYHRAEAHMDPRVRSSIYYLAHHTANSKVQFYVRKGKWEPNVGVLSHYYNNETYPYLGELGLSCNHDNKVKPLDRRHLVLGHLATMEGTSNPALMCDSWATTLSPIEKNMVSHHCLRDTLNKIHVNEPQAKINYAKFSDEFYQFSTEQSTDCLHASTCYKAGYCTANALHENFTGMTLEDLNNWKHDDFCKTHYGEDLFTNQTETEYQPKLPIVMETARRHWPHCAWPDSTDPHEEFWHHYGREACLMGWSHCFYMFCQAKICNHPPYSDEHQLKPAELRQLRRRFPASHGLPSLSHNFPTPGTRARHEVSDGGALTNGAPLAQMDMPPEPSSI